MYKGNWMLRTYSLVLDETQVGMLYPSLDNLRQFASCNLCVSKFRYKSTWKTMGQFKRSFHSLNCNTIMCFVATYPQDVVIHTPIKQDKCETFI